MPDVEAAIEDVLSREGPAVPLAPATARAVGELLGRGDLALDALRRHAFADPAIAAALLAAANRESGRPILSLPEAEERLGAAAFLRSIRETAAAAPAPGPLAELRLKVWRASVVSAVLCRELARERGLPPEDAYACGLLHDVGRLAALSSLERIVAAARPCEAAALQRWERIADRWHVALGTTFAARCRLPRAIREAIRCRAPGPRPTPLQQVVRSVDALVAVLLAGRDSDEAVDGAGISEPEAERLSRALERMQEHVASLEEPPAPPSEPRAAVAVPALREPKGQGLRLRVAGAEFAATGFARHQLIVFGPSPLGEGALLEVEVLDRRRSPFHARVLATWGDRGRFGAILLPLGLTGPSLAELGGTLPAGAFA
jgi:HD-like signal output (HDOD) protein